MRPSTHLHPRLACVITAIALVGFALGCTKSVSRDGEVFLVAASGDSQKLGLVEVFAVSPHAAPQGTIDAIADRQRLLNAAEKRLALAKSALKRYGEQMKQRGVDMHASAKRARDLSEQVSILRDMRNQSKEDIPALQRLRDAETAASAVRDQALQGVLDPWNGVVASPRAFTKSDSGGAFSIPCQSDDFICAYTTRAASEGTQHLVWIVRVEEMPPSGKLLLSNDNLVVLPGE
ncbi:MAG: hypothetical protein HQ464_08840 [Planctomycetes bacterium]|nr:hypothetical protein [Planctomycetota bacterium]